MAFKALDATTPKIAPTASFRPLSITPETPSVIATQKTNQPVDFSQINNTGPIFTTTPKNQGFTLGAGQKQVAGIGDIIKAAAEGGANQSLQGVYQAGEGLNTGNPIKMGEGTLNTIAGAINAVSAPLAPVFEPLSMATNYLGSKLGEHYSDNPILDNETATRIVQAISNAATIYGTFAGGTKAAEPGLPSEKVSTPPFNETPALPKAEVPVPKPEVNVSAQKAGTSGPFDVAPIDYSAKDMGFGYAQDNEFVKTPENMAKAYDAKPEQFTKQTIPLSSLKPEIGGKVNANARDINNAAPPVVELNSDGSYTILDGNHRIAEAAQAGYKNVPVWVIDKSSPSIPKEQTIKPTGRTTQTLKPIEGTGAVKTRGLSEGVEATAIEKKLTDNFGDLPEYRQVSMKDQALKAADLITKDPETAQAIAMGEKAPPKGLLPESVYVAAEQRAIAEGDVKTLLDLANSKLSASATTMGQRIRTLGERDSASPLAAIQEVQKARAEAQAARGVTPEKVVNTIKQAIRKTNTKETWSSFVESITC